MSFNPENFIARRILGKDKKLFSNQILPISITSICLGVAVMIIAISVVKGFQEQIKNKIVGFGGYVQIKNLDNNASLEALPIAKNAPWVAELKNLKGVKHLQSFIQKAAVIKYQQAIEGVILKGVGAEFDPEYFNSCLVSGFFPHVADTAKSDEILISKILAEKLQLSVNQRISMYFIQDPPRIRKFLIRGIYNTGFEEYDKKFVICDIRHLQKLNNWPDSSIAGFEVILDDYGQLDEMTHQISESIGYDVEAQSIKDLHPEIFDWLKLFDMNVAIIIIIMASVAGITMISTLLIIILEKTRDIGILMAVGASASFIRRVVMIKAIYILSRGMLLGNILGLGISWAQMQFHIIPLDQQSYYIPYVPIQLNIWSVLLINAITFISCFLLMLGPSFVITKISTIKAIRFD